MSNSEPPIGFGVVLFDSTQRAIGAERRLIAAGMAHKLIPVPRHLSPNCGFGLRFAWQDRDAIERLLSVWASQGWTIRPL